MDKKFTTRAFSTGVPTTLAGTPSLAVYKDNSATQSTAGVTLSVDFDGVAGLHNVNIDLSADGTFYAAGSNFDVVIAVGTVDGVSVVGEVVFSFSIQARNVGATQASVDAIDDLVDTEVGAIKTVVDAVKVQTDKLTFTVANVIDANVQRINDVAITGDGSATPFNVV